MEFVILFIVLIIGWSYIKARARIHHANKLMAERALASETEAPYPTWISNTDRMEEFAAMLNALAKRKKIPELFVAGTMTNEYSQNKLLFIAGLMEQRGASFEEQTVAVLDKIAEYWANMPQSDRRSFINKE